MLSEDYVFILKVVFQSGNEEPCPGALLPMSAEITSIVSQSCNVTRNIDGLVAIGCNTLTTLSHW